MNNQTTSTTTLLNPNSTQTLLQLNNQQNLVNVTAPDASVGHVLDASTLETAARLNSLSSSEALTTVLRPSRVAYYSNLFSSGGTVPPDETLKGKILAPAVEATPSLFTTGPVTISSEIVDPRPAIISLPSEELTPVSGPIFVHDVVRSLTPLPNESLLSTITSPVLSSATRQTLTLINNDLLAIWNNHTVANVLEQFEHLRSLRVSTYLRNHSFVPGTTPIPQNPRFDLWDFIIRQIFSLFSKDTLEKLYEIFFNLEVNLCCLFSIILVKILRPLFLTLLDVRFWTSSFLQIRNTFLRVLTSLFHSSNIPLIVNSGPTVELRTSLSVRLNSRYALFSAELMTHVRETLHSYNTLSQSRHHIVMQDYRQRLNRLSDAALINTQQVTNEAILEANTDLSLQHNEIRQNVARQSSFLERFRSFFSFDSLFSVGLTVSVALFGYWTRQRIWNFFADVLRQAFDSPQPQLSDPVVTSPALPSNLKPLLDFFLEAIEEAFHRFF